MYKYIVGFLAFATLTSLTLCKVYSGKCKETHSIQTTKLIPEGPFFSVFQIPLQIYQQEVYFFPSHEGQTLQLYAMNSYYPIAFIDPWYHEISGFRPAIYFNNETMRNEMFISNWKIRPFTYVNLCEVNKDISIMVFAYLDAVLLWACVNLEETNQHEETLWLFVKNYDQNLTAMAGIKNTMGYFEKYKPWVVKQLKNISSIRNANFEYYFQKKKNHYLKVSSDLVEIARCPPTQPTLWFSNVNYIIYFISCVAIAFFIFLIFYRSFVLLGYKNRFPK